MMAAASWANYPVANAWMSLHVWDHLDYSQDIEWYRKVGYPILKGTAEFWVSQLVEDTYFNDGTWVANSCNSPEVDPTVSSASHSIKILSLTIRRLLVVPTINK
jgi:alpha-L-fucosidase 2